MYVYIYDNFLRQRKYESEIKKIETRLTDYGIAGKIIRLQNYSDARPLIEEEIKKGTTTIVIVGNDGTFGQVLSRSAVCPVLFGFLPLGQENSIAEVLGIPVGEESCEVLSKRRKLKLDVGWFNNRYFVSHLHIPPSEIEIEYDEKFLVSFRDRKAELVVCNLQPFVWEKSKKEKIIVHPQDGKLEAFVRPSTGKGIFFEKFEDPSIFPFEEMIVSGRKPFLVEADGKTSKETEIKIRLSKKRLEMIVGKDRKF